MITDYSLIKSKVAKSLWKIDEQIMHDAHYTTILFHMNIFKAGLKKHINWHHPYRFQSLWYDLKS